jgi:hypothetical protein
MLNMTNSLLAILLLAPVFGSAQQGAFGNLADRYVSPDGMFVANVIPNGKEVGNKRAEDKIKIADKNGKVMSFYDFSSEDGEHGYGLDGGQWTVDSKFFVFRLRNSGGHSPMNAPIVFWSRSDSSFYQLNDVTGDIAFSVSPPDEVAASSLPDMKPAEISLNHLKPGQATLLEKVSH